MKKIYIKPDTEVVPICMQLLAGSEQLDFKQTIDPEGEDDTVDLFEQLLWKTNNPPLISNKGGLFQNKRRLLENKAGLLSDRGRFADIADMLTLIPKSNKKNKKGYF